MYVAIAPFMYSYLSPVDRTWLDISFTPFASKYYLRLFRKEGPVCLVDCTGQSKHCSLYNRIAANVIYNILGVLICSMCLRVVIYFIKFSYTAYFTSLLPEVGAFSVGLFFRFHWIQLIFACFCLYISCMK